jgi:hypothetical protein
VSGQQVNIRHIILILTEDIVGKSFILADANLQCKYLKMINVNLHYKIPVLRF